MRPRFPFPSVVDQRAVNEIASAEILCDFKDNLQNTIYNFQVDNNYIYNYIYNYISYQLLIGNIYFFQHTWSVEPTIVAAGHAGISFSLAAALHSSHVIS
jgi:hypothetical protein